MGLWVASEQIPSEMYKCLFIGELSFDGTVRHTNGVLSMPVAAQKEGHSSLFVPQTDAPEVSLAEGIDVIPLDSFHALMQHSISLTLWNR
jgi:magnesium chelatase family protein